MYFSWISPGFVAWAMLAVFAPQALSVGDNNAASIERWNDLMLNTPDPRKLGAKCGLQFETSQYYICDPDSLLTSEEQINLITALDQIHLTRTHQCSDGVSEPLLITLVLASETFNELEQQEDGESYPDLFLERVLTVAGQPAKKDATESAFDPPPMSKCSKQLAYMIQPYHSPPISSIRSESSFEPIFTEVEYPDLLEKSQKAFLTVRSEQNPGTTPLKKASELPGVPGLAEKLRSLINVIAADFPETGRKSLPASYELPVKPGADKQTLSSVIKSIGGKYEESVGNLEVEAEQQIARAIQGYVPTSETAFQIFIRNFKSLAIILGVFLCWTISVEILHQILLRRFSKTSDGTSMLLAPRGFEDDESSADYPLLDPTSRQFPSHHTSRHVSRSILQSNASSVRIRPPPFPSQPAAEQREQVARSRREMRQAIPRSASPASFPEDANREYDV